MKYLKHLKHMIATCIYIVVDLGALSYHLRLFPGPYRAGISGRLVPVGSNCVSRSGVISRGSAHPRSEKRVRVRSGVGPGLPVGEAVRRRAEDQSELSGRRGRPESEAGAVPPRPGLSVGDLDRPSGLSCRYLGRPKSYVSFVAFVSWAEPLLGSWSMRDPGFMNPTLLLVKIFFSAK